MKIIKLIAFIAITLLFSCEDLQLINCEKCTISEPAEADLMIRVSESFQSTSISVVSIYEGDLEDNILFKTAIPYDSEFPVKVPLNKKYTVTVTYSLTTGKYVAVDSALPRIKFDEDQCDDPCYYIYDNTVNLKLKYQ